MRPKDRTRARALCHEHTLQADPLGWFEPLYREAAGDDSIVPWADLEPNPHLVRWRERSRFELTGRRCLKIGCGLGDDAEYLAGLGARVTAFDIAPTAIDWCRRRFPNSSVNYQVSDLFAPPEDWIEAFDLVLESYTLQVLPAEIRPRALHHIASTVAPGGTLLIICRGRGPDDPPGTMPWPLLREELQLPPESGLAEVEFEDYLDAESPPVRRFRAGFLRSPGTNPTASGT